MGAKQRAQARGNKAAKGSLKGAPKSQKQLNQSMLVPDLSPASRNKSLQNWTKFSESSSNNHGFSMMDEANRTDRRTNGWGSTTLRTQAISFVSAGPLKRDEDAWNTVSEDDSPQKQSDTEPIAAQTEAAGTSPNVPNNGQSHAVPATAQPSLEPSTSPFEPSTVQIIAPPKQEFAPNGYTASYAHLPRSTSSSSSDSEEEIVFGGRSATSQQPSRKPTPAPPTVMSTAPPVQPHTTPVTTIASQCGPDSLRTNMTFASTAIGLGSPQDTPVPGPARSKRPKDDPFNKLLYGRKYDEDAMMQDYIDNMAIDDSEEESGDASAPALRRKPFKKTETIRMFNGDGLENAKVQTKDNNSRKIPSDVPIQAIDWDSDDLADFDDISTTDDEVEVIGQVIRHRSRVSGKQYLVVARGAEASDAKWMLHSSLVSESAVKEIKIYEEIRLLNIEEDDYDDEDEDDDDSEGDEDEEGLQDLVDEIDSEDDENARIMELTSRMTDEQIAKALAKQEELGFGGDELMLFNGDVADDNDMDDAFGAGDDFIAFSLTKHTSNRGRSKRNKKQRDSFPSGEALADAIDQDPYGAFDIMDFERPSLRPKKKGRKSDFPWDLEDVDEELRDHLANTWTRDREKKAERKRQREEARLTANLDMAEAGDPDVIKAQIRQFLVQNVDVLRLSPMEANVRAGVHRLAKVLKMNSRSEGKDGIGLGRYPVLTKTASTRSYTFETIHLVDALMNTRKFFPKPSGFSARKTPRTPGSARLRQRGGGGGVMSGATYKDGDVVGASAPELGSENKGRAMLEKMGWTAGMGIGAIGNKGGLEHISHVVKTSKAGLG